MPKIGRFGAVEAVAACEAAGLDLASGKNIGILSALAANQTWSGITAKLTAGEILTIGECCYMAAGGKMWLASGAAASTLIPAVALATEGLAADAEGIFLLIGFFREDTVFNFAAGDILYTSDVAAGALTATAPAANTEMVQRVGICFPSAHIVYFKPDLTVCEVKV
jgi:hypothetical protein